MDMIDENRVTWGRVTRCHVKVRISKPQISLSRIQSQKRRKETECHKNMGIVQPLTDCRFQRAWFIFRHCSRVNWLFLCVGKHLATLTEAASKLFRSEVHQFISLLHNATVSCFSKLSFSSRFEWYCNREKKSKLRFLRIFTLKFQKKAS